MTHEQIRRLAADFRLVLGSTSPRRRQLLAETGVTFRQLAPDVDETPRPNEPPRELAERLAREKAVSLVPRLEPDEFVLAGDTVVALDGTILGKPEDPADAFRILSLLSGRTHEVCTALALAGSDGILVSGYEVTQVTFNSLSATQIKAYIETGEPMDKAGAYGIQGMGGFLVDCIDGNLDTVVGFPGRLLEALAETVRERRFGAN